MQLDKDGIVALAGWTYRQHLELKEQGDRLGTEVSRLKGQAELHWRLYCDIRDMVDRMALLAEGDEAISAMKRQVYDVIHDVLYQVRHELRVRSGLTAEEIDKLERDEKEAEELPF